MQEKCEKDDWRVGEEKNMMEIESKEVLLIDPPPDYSASPQLPGLPCKKLLMTVVVILAAVLTTLGIGLMGLYITEKHTEAVLQMTIQGLDGEGSSQHLSMSRKERLATFHVSLKANASATVVYDYSQLLIGYRSFPGPFCFVTRMDKENIQSLDAVVKAFQAAQPRLLTAPKEEKQGRSVPMINRSVLGTTMNILCSTIPIYWA